MTLHYYVVHQKFAATPNYGSPICILPYYQYKKRDEDQDMVGNNYQLDDDLHVIKQPERNTIYIYRKSVKAINCRQTACIWTSWPQIHRHASIVRGE